MCESIPDPEHSIGIVEINGDGTAWQTVWGFEGGAEIALATSEPMKNTTRQSGRTMDFSAPDLILTLPTRNILIKIAAQYRSPQKAMALWGLFILRGSLQKFQYLFGGHAHDISGVLPTAEYDIRKPGFCLL